MWVWGVWISKNLNCPHGTLSPYNTFLYKREREAWKIVTILSESQRLLTYKSSTKVFSAVYEQQHICLHEYISSHGYNQGVSMMPQLLQLFVHIVSWDVYERYEWETRKLQHTRNFSLTLFTTINVPRSLKKPYFNHKKEWWQVGFFISKKVEPN